jgi:GxxExxY protein
VVGCGFEVLNEVGHGLKEKTYENSLVVEFGLRAIPLNSSVGFPWSVRAWSFRSMCRI